MSKDEISKDFYCSGFSESICGHHPNCPESCRQRHRKYPTPGQFKKKYGMEWTGAVYVHCFRLGCSDICDYFGWVIYENIASIDRDTCGYMDEPIIVCACTPWGKPPDDWRPE
jgi:hypothetical protein